jgi:transposase
MEAIMAAWSLSDKECDALDRLRFSTNEAAVFRNATIILMSATGRSKASIACDLGCSIGTVDFARQRYRQSGPKGLIPGKPPGRASRATPEYRAALRTAVETPPQELGYGFSVWSVARLNAHLLKETGIGFGDDQLRRILKQEGFSFQRPKHTMRGKRDEAAFQKAGRKLRALKKKPFARTPSSR